MRKDIKFVLILGIAALKALSLFGCVKEETVVCSTSYVNETVIINGEEVVIPVPTLNCNND